MRRLLSSALLLSLLTACPPRESLRYPHSTAENAAQGWADAFNRHEPGQLRLLVHPERRALFDAHLRDVETQFTRFDIKSFELAGPIELEGGLRGREVVFVFHDGQKIISNRAVLVETDGAFWLWRY